KENCPDPRNSKALDIVRELQEFNADVDVWDPWVGPAECRALGIACLTEAPAPGRYHAVILAVGHDQFVALGSAGIRAFGVPDAILYDVKGVFPRQDTDGRL